MWPTFPENLKRKEKMKKWNKDMIRTQKKGSKAKKSKVIVVKKTKHKKTKQKTKIIKQRIIKKKTNFETSIKQKLWNFISFYFFFQSVPSWKVRGVLFFFFFFLFEHFLVFKKSATEFPFKGEGLPEFFSLVRKEKKKEKKE